MGFITADRTQGDLFGYSLDDFVDKEAKCRLIVKLVNKLDLSALYSEYSTQGGDAYDPRMMTATWFFAYSERINTTRKLESACKRDMHFIFVSSNLQPDHCSLSRFRKRHEKVLPDLFVQVARLAMEEHGDGRLIAIDGTKMRAASSRSKNRTSEGLSKDLESVRKLMKRYIEKCDLLDEISDSEDIDQVRTRISNLKEEEARLERRSKELESRKECLQKRDKEKHKINIEEPDARNMVKVNGLRAAPAFNAQIGVDTESRMIVAEDVTTDTTDQQQFIAQHENAERVLGGDIDREYVADAGYNTLGELEHIESKQIKVTLADPRPSSRISMEEIEDKESFDRGDFFYNKEGDYYKCPAGKKLNYTRTNKKRGRDILVYVKKKCKGCRYSDKCFKAGSKGLHKLILRDAKENLAEQMARRAASEDGRKKMHQRRSTVEPIIGNIKENLGFRRFRLKGLLGVKAEFALMCIAHNINRIHTLNNQNANPENSPIVLRDVINGFLLRLKRISINSRCETQLFTLIRAVA